MSVKYMYLSNDVFKNGVTQSDLFGVGDQFIAVAHNRNNQIIAF